MASHNNDAFGGPQAAIPVYDTYTRLDGGGTGVNWSANSPAFPNIGATWPASGPYSGWVLIATVPANPSRTAIEVRNGTAAVVAVMRDNGTAAASAAPVQPSVFGLSAAAAAGGQGGNWASLTFKGRIQVYASSGTSQVAIFED